MGIAGMKFLQEFNVRARGGEASIVFLSDTHKRTRGEFFEIQAILAPVGRFARQRMR